MLLAELRLLLSCSFYCVHFAEIEEECKLNRIYKKRKFASQKVALVFFFEMLLSPVGLKDKLFSLCLHTNNTPKVRTKSCFIPTAVSKKFGAVDTICSYCCINTTSKLRWVLSLELLEAWTSKSHCIVL